MKPDSFSQPILSAFADDEIVASLLGVFLEELRAHYQAIRTAHAAGDRQSLARLCHKTRGAAATYGYPDLSTALSALEREAATADGDSDRLAAGVTALDPIIERIAAGIEAPKA